MDLLLSPSELRAVQALRLQPRRTVAGRQRGERVSRRKGVSIEFADYRDYTDGDDLRHLDWNVMARLGQAVMKTYQDEEDLTVYLLVDPSRSLDFGEPTKHRAVRRVGLGLAMAALLRGDAVRPVVIGEAHRATRTFRGRAGYTAVSQMIAKAPYQRSHDLAQSLRQFAEVDLRSGVVIVLTDAMDPQYTTALRALASRGHEVWTLCMLSPEERDPELEGDLRLVDAETGPPREITANRATIEAYRAALDAHLNEVRKLSLAVGGRFAEVTTDMDWHTIFHRVLRKEGWVA